MTQQITIVLVDSDSRARNETLAIINSFGGHVCILAAGADLQEVSKVIQTANPQIIMLEVKEIEKGIKEITFLVSKFTQSTVFVTAADKNPDWILRLVRAGAGEYLTKPVVTQELAEAIKKVARLHTRKSGQNREKGSVVTVYNPTAGMGTTTIAVNLAAMLAGQGKQAALIDLNLYSGDVAAFLDMAPRYTLSSIIAKKGQIDASLLKSVLVPHASGVHVLNGPWDLMEAGRIPPELLQEVIDVLQSSFEYVVIDCGGQLSGCNLATFDCSDRILFTTILNLPALNNAKRYLAAMDREGLPPDRIKLVINRHSSRDDIKVGDAEKVLNNKAYLTVPNAYADASTSINKGVPLITCYPRSSVTKSMEELAGKLTKDLRSEVPALKETI